MDRENLLGGPPATQKVKIKKKINKKRK